MHGLMYTHVLTYKAVVGAALPVTQQSSEYYDPHFCDDNKITMT